MKYTKKQLIKAMQLYYKDSLLNEENYEDTVEGTVGEAKRTIEKLIEFIK